MGYHPPATCKKCRRKTTESIYAKRWILTRGKWTNAIIGYRCRKCYHTLFYPENDNLVYTRPKRTQWKPSK